MASDARLCGLLAFWGDGAEAREQVLRLLQVRLRQVLERETEEGACAPRPAALVREIWFDLSCRGNLGAEARGGFFRAAAEAMRGLLVDLARHREAVGPSCAPPGVAMSLEAAADLRMPESVLAMDAALRTLATDEPRAAEVVRLRVFAGLCEREIAETMGISEQAVACEWSFARARLYQLVHGEAAGDRGS